MVSWAAGAVIARAASAGKWLYSPSKRPEAGKTSIFYLKPLALSYLRSKKPCTKVGSVMYQINETELSFLNPRTEWVSRQMLRSCFCSFCWGRRSFVFCLHLGSVKYQIKLYHFLVNITIYITVCCCLTHSQAWSHRQVLSTRAVNFPPAKLKSPEWRFGSLSTILHML